MSEVERVNSIIDNSIPLNKRVEYSNSIGTRPAKRNKTRYTEEEARRKAIYLVDKFKNPDGLLFYLKCAWNLADWYIDWLTEYSFNKENPGKYFVKVASQKMNENA